jgi:hypothetical protein
MEKVKNGEMEQKRNWTICKSINLQKLVHLYYQVNFDLYGGRSVL